MTQNRISPVRQSKVGIVVFPGSNCDQDNYKALKNYFQIESTFIWHQETNLPPLDLVILPGGFSYGDYLRSGALASHSPVMGAVKNFMQHGGGILGICNGFQILTESHLLEGALLHNIQQKFICQFSWVKNSELNTPLRIPIAHGEGRYFADQEILSKLQNENRVFLSYCNENGETNSADNPNGSLENIAGITGKKNEKIIGMMPHPERAMDKILGKSSDGILLWEKIFEKLLG